MGNKPKRTKEREKVAPRTIQAPGTGVGDIAVAEEEPHRWTFAVEDLTAVAHGIEAGVAARAAPGTPRFPVYAGRDIIGFAPIDVSAEMRSELRAGAGVLLGQVMSVDLKVKRVVVEISLEGT